MSKYLIGIAISGIIAILYSYFIGHNSRQLYSIPSFYLVVLAIYAIQIVAFVPAAIYNTEVFYDLTGSIAFITATLICLLTEDTLSTKQSIAAGMVLIWTFRLGGFLFYRVIKSKEDSRFRKIKEDKIRFFMAWFIQALWVTVTAGHIYSFLTEKPQQKVQTDRIGVVQVIGMLIWSIGFLSQSTADFQKLLFNSDPKNKGKFINSGLWAYSRHPNYCGQVIVWLGSAIFVSRSLQGWQNLSLISPLFVYLLLTKLSGVPMLQAKADKKWGGTKQYQEYKSKTPVMFPWMPPTTSASNVKSSEQKTS